MSDPVTHLVTVETTTEDAGAPVILLPTGAWIYIGLHLPEELGTLRETGALPEGAPEFGPGDNLVAVGMNNVDRETTLAILRCAIETMEQETQE